ncbi:IS3 family transposase [Lacticaseibacillus jixiensis]|uniref:IS3 family transposase n=1 Tax=Lacticaseibacillus jixiensis TaxID=3231926 RepID=UPI0036F1EF9F
MCRILGVSRAQYYHHRSPKPSKRRAEDADLKQRILRIFAEFKQRYGVMKIHHELNLELQPLQLRCSPRRISRLMKELDIHSVTVNLDYSPRYWGHEIASGRSESNVWIVANTD